MSDPKPAEAKRLAERLLEFADDSCCDEDDDSTGDDLRASAALLLAQAERIAELELRISQALGELRPSHGVPSVAAACAALEKKP